MKEMRSILLLVLVASLAMLVLTMQANATSVTFYEFIGVKGLFNTPPSTSGYFNNSTNLESGFTAPDLTRKRFDGTTTTTVTDDSIIVPQNSIGVHFGVKDLWDVTYSHKTDWLSQSVFTSATLEIYAASIDDQGALGAPNDPVLVDLEALGFLTGALNYGGGDPLVANLFNISGTDITLYLADDTLSVRIEKRGFSNSDNNDNAVILGSKLSLTYDNDPTPPGDGTATVPEPATLLLLGFGLIGLAGVRRKFRK